MKTVKVALFWTIGISFVIIGILKYLNVDAVTGETFTRAHFPRWFFYVVATIEFVGGILLLLTASTSKQIGSLQFECVIPEIPGGHTDEPLDLGPLQLEPVLQQ